MWFLKVRETIFWPWWGESWHREEGSTKTSGATSVIKLLLRAASHLEFSAKGTNSFPCFNLNLNQFFFFFSSFMLPEGEKKSKKYPFRMLYFPKWKFIDSEQFSIYYYHIHDFNILLLSSYCVPDPVADSVSTKMHNICSCPRGTYISLGEHTSINYIMGWKVLLIDAQGDVDATRTTIAVVFEVVGGAEIPWRRDGTF